MITSIIKTKRDLWGYVLKILIIIGITYQANFFIQKEIADLIEHQIESLSKNFQDDGERFTKSPGRA